jgi:hypothetical protein
MNTRRPPEEIWLWMGHEVAECVNYPKFLPADYGDGTDERWFELSRKLWRFTTNAERPVPSGGDGSPDAYGNPTVETPDEQTDYRIDSDDNAGAWWKHLTKPERVAIHEACAEEFAASRAMWAEFEAERV